MKSNLADSSGRMHSVVTTVHLSILELVRTKRVVTAGSSALLSKCGDITSPPRWAGRALMIEGRRACSNSRCYFNFDVFSSICVEEVSLHPDKRQNLAPR